MPSTQPPHQSGESPLASELAPQPAGASSSRRTFLGWLAAVVPVSAGFRLPFGQSLRGYERIDPALLRALATTILPSELGVDGVERAAGAFEKWVAGYRAGAELNHGYGSDRIRTTAADPSTRWALQLRTLDSDARRAHRGGFVSITGEQRRAIARAQLAEDGATALPGDIAGAGHVALALLASFYASPAATDLCYEAAIARNACRPLAAVTEPPVPLRRGGGRS